MKFIGTSILLIIIILLASFLFVWSLDKYLISFSLNINSMATLMNLFITVLLVVVTMIYTFFTFKIFNNNYSPKLYIVPLKKDAKNEWNKTIMKEFINDDLSREGFVYKKSEKKMNVEIFNNGNKPATNIKVNYNVVTYINNVEFGMDRADIVNYEPVVYKKVSKTIHIDYLPPNTSKEFTIFYMSRFPRIDLEIEQLKSNEDNFINDRTKIHTFQNREFNKIQDSNHLRKLLGVY